MQSAAAEDTIVACATPQGPGAIAVIRLSGPDAAKIGRQLSARNKPFESHRLVRVWLSDPATQAPLDEGMAVWMQGPRSYTGEDVLELHVHGSSAVVQGVLAACGQLGARPAQPGEFTLRAFLSGRLDLTQAEAVAALIASQTELQREVALRQMQGSLAKAVCGLLDPLEVVLADWRAALDFPEYPTGEGLLRAHLATLRQVLAQVTALVEGARLDVHRGQQVVLCGAPNVGKSSLLNAWLGRERVLVDDAPGTTRDPVEVRLGFEGWQISLWDTAGLRRDAEELEQRGIQMAAQHLEQADVALWLVDPIEPIWPDVKNNVVVVGSKADLADPARRRELTELAAARGCSIAFWVSPKTREGIDALSSCLRQKLGQQAMAASEAVVVQERHLAGLRRAGTALVAVLEGAEAQTTLDMLAFELEAAVRALGEILGRDVDLSVLDRIFEQFCIGK